MQRDDRKDWSIWQLLFPLLLSLCILILRSRLKSSPVSGPADRLEVSGGEASDAIDRREAGDGDDVGEREDEMEPDEGSDVVYTEEIVEIVENGGVEEDNESEIAENGEEIENEQTDGEAEAGLEVEAYCVKCRQKRNMEDPREIETKNGRHALEGTCPVCGTHLFRFVAR